jgi:TIR domain
VPGSRPEFAHETKRESDSPAGEYSHPWRIGSRSNGLENWAKVGNRWRASQRKRDVELMASVAAYRREDSEDIAGRIFDRLTSRFGRDNVFMDIDTIPLGCDFRKLIADAVSKCDVILAVIGKHWLELCYHDGPKQGMRRLDDPTDFVRIEIQTGLDRDIPVIPVIVGGAAYPKEQQLPEVLKPLAFRNAAEVRSGRDFEPTVASLVRGIEAITRPHCVFYRSESRLMSSMTKGNKPIRVA